ncbi:multiple sugar transport system substrate-binding protein [Naumannella cuiyingiana]|uniref:Multiple sugar transport system substrate-binding protein n=2 Tax=Naumannella cuiyingiana TaxID=1347891 RepID=A0A7Z0ILF2_9ACTN|nr:multiple sugar transport system substrate-binding protein [Naumannella cuiyingiana]
MNPMPLSAMSRRTLLAATLGAAAAGALGACAPRGGSAPAPAGEGDGSLTFWHYYGGGATAPLEKLLARYSEESGVQVTPRLIPFGDFNRTLLQAATAAGLPDIALVNAFDTALFAQSEMITDVSSRVNTWGQSDQYFSGPWATTQVGGATYAVPHVADTYSLWINNELLPDAGVETWSDVERAAGSVAKDGVSGLAFSGIEGVEGSTAFILRFLAAGGDIRKLDSEAGLAALESLRGMVESGAVSEGVLTWIEDDVTTQFQNGTAAMMINSASYLSGLREAGVDLRVAPMPADREQVSFLSAENLTITRDSGNPDAAWELITWLQRPEVMNEYLPERNKLPVRSDTAEDPQWSDPTIRVFVDQLDVAWAPDEETAPASAEIFTAAQGALQAALSGSSSPADALARAQATVDKALA